MEDYDEQVFLNEEMANLDFPMDEVDGDKLEALKEEQSDEKKFRQWFRSQASKSFLNIAGIDSFIRFLSDLPLEERRYIETMMKEKAILGNPSLETNFMLRYGTPFAMDSMYEGMSLMSDELNGINRTLADESIHNIMLMREEMRTFASMIKKAVQVSISEIEAAGARQVVAIQAQREKQLLDIQAQVVFAQNEVAKSLETHEKNLEVDRMAVRKTAYKEIAKKIEEVAGKALSDSLGKYNMKHAFYNAGAVIAGMTVFSILHKLFS